jgi:hypothetical protein
MYKIEYESIYDPVIQYHRQFMSKAEAIWAANHIIEDGLRSYYKIVITCRITSPLHPNEVIVVREGSVHTYKIPIT